MTKRDPFRYFKTNREIIRLAVMLYVRFPLSLTYVEGLLYERGVDISHTTVRYWWHRFGPMFAAEVQKHCIAGMKSSCWRWHLDEVLVKINGEMCCLWLEIDHEGGRRPIRLIVSHVLGGWHSKPRFTQAISMAYMAENVQSRSRPLRH